MSFIITVYTNEGIVMASDSRTTYTTETKKPDGVVEQKVGIQITDTTNKTFLCPNNIGISTCGTSSIGSAPIAGYIEDFITKKLNEEDTVETVSDGLKSYFSQIDSNLGTTFIIAGYDMQTLEQKVRRVRIKDMNTEIIDTSNAGATWSGESDTLIRLLNPVALKKNDGQYADLTNYGIGFNFFTLQDAINFAEYAVDVTIKTMQFQDRIKTVGGPIDILVIKPNGAEWIAKKKLHA